MKRCGLKRNTPLKRKGKERGKPLPLYRAWIREQGCHICGRTPVQAAHLPRVKAHGDEANLIPLCQTPHHTDVHQIGVKSFAAYHGLDLAEVATAYWRAYNE
jgi:hypothetical protein